jgi:hypothetical protein
MIMIIIIIIQAISPGITEQVRPLTSECPQQCFVKMKVPVSSTGQRCIADSSQVRNMTSLTIAILGMPQKTLAKN